jgi:AraC-like DNA-binding protein
VVVTALIRSPAEQQAITAAVEGLADVQFVRRATELVRRVEREDVSVVVTELTDVTGAPMGDTIGLLRARRKPPLVVAVINLEPGDMRAVAACGVTTLCIRGYDDLGAVVHAALLRVPPPDAATAILVRLMPRIPPALHPVLAAAAQGAKDALTVEALADAVRTPRRTIEDRLRRADLPTLEPLIGWMRLLHAAWHLETAGATVDGVAKQLAFPSGPALRALLRRYTGWSTTQLRQHGGFSALLTACERALRPEPMAAPAASADADRRCGAPPTSPVASSARPSAAVEPVPIASTGATRPVVALVRSETVRAAIREALRDRTSVLFCDHVDALERLVLERGARLVIADPRDAADQPTTPVLQALRVRRPSLRLLSHVALTSADVHDAAHSWATAALIRDHDDVGRVVRAAFDATQRDVSPGELLAAGVARVPRAVRPYCAYCAWRAPFARTVQAAAASAGIPYRTLERRLTALGLPSPKTLLTWYRLLHAAWRLELGASKREAAAVAVGFRAGRALTAALRRYVGVSWTDLRAIGFAGLLARFDTLVLTPAIGPRPGDDPGAPDATLTFRIPPSAWMPTSIACTPSTTSSTRWARAAGSRCKQRMRKS